MVEQGSPRPAYREGISKQHFEFFPKEFSWIENQFERKITINRRRFCERFPDFDFVVPQEDLNDLLKELRSERAYSQISALIESASETLLPENAVDTAENMREVISDVVREFSPHSDISMKDWKDHFERVKQRGRITKAGQTFGMPLYVPTLDYHWDGLVPGRLYGVLARPGHAKALALNTPIPIPDGWTTMGEIKVGDTL